MLSPPDTLVLIVVHVLTLTSLPDSLIISKKLASIKKARSVSRTSNLLL